MSRTKSLPPEDFEERFLRNLDAADELSAKGEQASMLCLLLAF